MLRKLDPSGKEPWIVEAYRVFNLNARDHVINYFAKIILAAFAARAYTYLAHSNSSPEYEFSKVLLACAWFMSVEYYAYVVMIRSWLNDVDKLSDTMSIRAMALMLSNGLIVTVKKGVKCINGEGESYNVDELPQRMRDHL